MTDTWMSDAVIQQAYDLEAGAAFEDHFSKVSIESILFYVFAVAVWTLEKVFDAHRADILTILAEKRPHTRQWYVGKAKAFMFGRALVSGEDYYDTSEMSDAEIAAAQVVKYASITAGADYRLVLKIAGADGSGAAPIAAEQFSPFIAYMDEVKDAGVALTILNEEPDDIEIEMTIYYDPMLMNSYGELYAEATLPVHDAIRRYLSALPFNGEFRMASLVDAVQQAAGVVMPCPVQIRARRHGVAAWTTITSYAYPYAGYYRITDEALNNGLTFVAHDN
jgi:hypothetical protein